MLKDWDQIVPEAIAIYQALRLSKEVQTKAWYLSMMVREIKKIIFKFNYLSSYTTKYV